jgi:hypothetical protein
MFFFTLEGSQTSSPSSIAGSEASRRKENAA